MHTVIRQLADQWLPIPWPEEKHLPPTVKAEMAHPAVTQAMRSYAMQIFQASVNATVKQAKRDKYSLAARNYRRQARIR